MNSAIAAYYYLRIIVAIYMHEPGEATEDIGSPAPALNICDLGECHWSVDPGYLPLSTDPVRRTLGFRLPVVSDLLASGDISIVDLGGRFLQWVNHLPAYHPSETRFLVA